MIAELLAVGCFVAIGRYYQKSTSEKRKFRILFEQKNLFKGNMYPILKEKTETSYGHCLRFTLPIGLSLKDFENAQESIENMLGKRVRIIYDNKNILIQVYKNDLVNYPFEIIDTSKNKNEFSIVIGFTYGKQPVKIDLLIEPHLLIAGETGSGKSTIINAILATLILTRDNVELVLIDLKRGVEFSSFKNCKQTVVFAQSIEEAKNTLQDIRNEIDDRYDLIYEKNCKNIVSYNQKNKDNPLSYKFVVIDEFALLRNDKESMSKLIDIAGAARACGIHLIISTQRPSAKVIDGEIKANLPAVIGLKCHDKVNSGIIIDESGLEKLKGRGHGMLRYKGQLIEFQGMNLQEDKLEELLKPYQQPQTKNAALSPQEDNKIIGKVKSLDFIKEVNNNV